MSPLFQDADCIFLNKEELEVKVDLLRRQLELLKCVFEEVSFSGPSQEFGGASGAPNFYSLKPLLDASRPNPWIPESMEVQGWYNINMIMLEIGWFPLS